MAESFWHRVGVYFAVIEQPPPNPGQDLELGHRSRREILMLSAKYFLLGVPTYTLGWFIVDGVTRGDFQFGRSTVEEGVAFAALMALVLFFKARAASDGARARLAATRNAGTNVPAPPTDPTG